MILSKRLRLALTLAPFLLGPLTFAMLAQAATPSGGQQHLQMPSGHHDFHRFHNHDRHDRFGFGFGFGDPWWWGWDSVQYWGYPYPYYYPYPPYPAYYAPPPPPPAEAPVQATGAPPPQYWYYCDNPQGYYPYVANCNSTWRQVTPTQQSGNTVTPKQ